MTTESQPADAAAPPPSPAWSSAASPSRPPRARPSTSSTRPTAGSSPPRRRVGRRTWIARSRRPAQPSRTARAGRTGPPASAAGRWPSSPTSSSGNSEELAQLESRNVGKPISGARGEVIGASLVFDYYAGAANKVFGQTIPVSKPGLDLTLREPIGVCGLIVPWNFPLLMASWKVAPALAAGNTAILKPAIVHAADGAAPRRAGAGGGHPAGRPQRRDRPGRVGRRRARRPPGRRQGRVHRARRRPARRSCGWPSGNVKKVSLELGGKSPNIVFADADLEKFARESPYSVFDNAGQDCCARSRILVERSVHERVVELFTRRPGRSRSATRPTRRPRSAPSSATKQRDRVKDYIEIGLGEGATLVVGGDGAGRSGPGRRRVSPADGVRRRRQRHAHRPRGDLRPGGQRHPVRHGGGGAAPRQRDAVRPVAARSGAATSARRCGRPRPSRRASSGSTRTRRSTPRRRSAATRCRASGASSG